MARGFNVGESADRLCFDLESLGEAVGYTDVEWRGWINVGSSTCGINITSAAEVKEEHKIGWRKRGSVG